MRTVCQEAFRAMAARSFRDSGRARQHPERQVGRFHLLASLESLEVQYERRRAPE